jgi:hypothetical protein
VHATAALPRFFRLNLSAVGREYRFKNDPKEFSELVLSLPGSFPFKRGITIMVTDL